MSSSPLAINHPHSPARSTYPPANAKKMVIPHSSSPVREVNTLDWSRSFRSASTSTPISPYSAVFITDAYHPEELLERIKALGEAKISKCEIPPNVEYTKKIDEHDWVLIAAAEITHDSPSNSFVIHRISEEKSIAVPADKEYVCIYVPLSDPNFKILTRNIDKLLADTNYVPVYESVTEVKQAIEKNEFDDTLLTEALKQNHDLGLFVLAKNRALFEHSFSHFRQDQEFLLKAIRNNHEWIGVSKDREKRAKKDNPEPLPTQELLDNEDFMLEALKITTLTCRVPSAIKVRSSFKFMSIALTWDARAYRHVTLESGLLANSGFMLSATKRDLDFMKVAERLKSTNELHRLISPELLKDSAFMCAAMENNPEIWKIADESLYADFAFALKMVTHDKKLYSKLPKELKKNLQIREAIGVLNHSPSPSRDSDNVQSGSSPTSSGEQ